MIEMYYDMPHLEAYLNASGAKFSENQLNEVVHEFLTEVRHHGNTE